MSSEFLRKRIFLQSESGARRELTLWLGTPYQKEVNGIANWHVDWGIIGLLDRARELVGLTAFDAMVANLDGMKQYLKPFAKGHEIVDADLEALSNQNPNAGLGNGVVTISELFGKP